MRGVGRVVDLDAQVLEPVADAGADRGRLLADAAGEHERVEPAEHRRQRADVLAGLVAEDVDGERGTPIPLPPLQQRLHVRGVARQRDEPCFPVDELLETVGVVALLVQQVDGYAGVEVAGAGAHDQPARGAEAQGRLDRLPVVDGDHAGPVAEVSDDGPAELRRAERTDDVFVRQPVEAIPPYAHVPEGVGQRQALRELGHVAMKCGVEARHLRDVPPAADRVDAGDRRRHVQRRELDELVEVGEHVVVDEGGLRVAGPAVHDAMAGGARRREPLLVERREGGVERGRVVTRLHRVRGPGHRAFGRAFYLEQRRLQRRRAAVHAQDDERSARAHGLQRQSRTSGMSSRCSTT